MKMNYSLAGIWDIQQKKKKKEKFKVFPFT